MRSAKDFSETGDRGFRRGDALIDAGEPGVALLRRGLQRGFFGVEPAERGLGVGRERPLALQIGGELRDAAIEFADALLGARFLALERFARDQKPLQGRSRSGFDVAQARQCGGGFGLARRDLEPARWCARRRRAPPRPWRARWRRLRSRRLTVSISAFGGGGSSTAAATAKAGLAGLTRELARGLAPAVRVNGIAPGLVHSNWECSFGDLDALAQASIPLARVGEPEDYAQVIVFLCAGGAYITGEVIS